MDSQALEALKSAYKLSPENQPLLLILIKALLDAGESDTAYFLLEDKNPAAWPSGPDREHAAKACLVLGDFDRAFAFASEDTPAQLLLRAHALLGLKRLDEGRQAYEAAIERNPTIEDQVLAARLSPADAQAGDSDRGRSPEPERVRSIANDDTTATEITRVLQPDDEAVHFRDVGGHANIKELIRKRIILPFQKPSLFQRFRRKAGGGILMYGPPGCGKTLLARATAGECEASFFNVSIADVLDMFIGQSEHHLHAIFEQARAKTPSVLFFDELEALGGKREYTREATSSKLVSQFLAEMDGFAQNNQGVLVLAATNVPWAIDLAFRRPGRFDRTLFVPPPDAEARLAILELLIAERPVEPGLNLKALIEKTSTFSGADLRNLVETAADEAIDASLAADREVPISMAHLTAALREVKPTTLDWLTTARNYARYANEGGHYDDVLAFLRRHGKA